MNTMYTISIEKINNEWTGILDKVINYNIPPFGSNTREKEVTAFSYIELLKVMVEEGFFLLMEDNNWSS